MKHSKSTAEILITYHLERKDWGHKKYYIPKSLCIDDQLRLIEEYIESENVNPNYLKLLYKSRSRNEFPIPDEVRLKAKKRYENYFKDSFSNESCFSFGAVVGFANTDEVISIDNKDLLNPKIIYSHSWLKENLNNPTLLNNFVFLFGYVDSHTRSTFPSKKTELGVMEKILGVKGDREYDVGVSFDFKEMISSMQIKTYYYELLKLDKRLEEIFKWFFEEYLLVEFQVDGFILSIPSNKSSFLEKVRTLCSEIDSILRQFTNYVNSITTGHELDDLLKYDSFDVMKSLSNKISNLNSIGIFKNKSPPFDSNKNIWRYDIKSLEADEKALFVSFLCEQLFLRAVQRGEQDDVVEIIVLDEAHLFVNDDPKNPINVIAKEARKFGLALLAASQSPTHFSDDFLSNVSTKIILGVDQIYWSNCINRLKIPEEALKWIIFHKRILIQINCKGDVKNELLWSYN